MAFGTAETAKLLVDLSLTGNFTSQLGKVNQTLSKTAANLDRTQSRAYRAGQQIGTGIKRSAVLAAAGVGFLVSQVVAGTNSLINLEKATTQTAAVIRSTKGAAGQTSASIRQLAEGFESLNAQMDDTVIQSGANVLLTFTNIRQKAFKPALQAALDLSTAMHQDLQTSVVQIGKALNDPAKGLTSLQRIGVSFDKDQVKQIKNLVKHNKLFEAQGIILRELNKEFGGSFAAGGKTIAGRFASIGDAVEDLQRTLATALLPTVSKVAVAIESMLRDPTVVKGISDFGQMLADSFTSRQIVDGIKSVTDSFGTLVDLVKIAAAPVKTIVGAFLALPKEVQTVLVGAFAVNKLTGGLVTNVFGGIAEAIAKSFIRAPLVNVQGGVVNVAGGAGGVPGAIGKGGGFSLLGGLTAAGIGLAIAAAFKGAFQDPEFQKQTDAIGKSVQAQLDSKRSLADLLQTQAALQQGIRDLTVVDQQGNPVPVLNDIAGLLYGGQKQALQDKLTLINAAIAAAKYPPNYYSSARQTDATVRRTAFSKMESTRGSRGDALFREESRKNPKPVQTADIESLRGRIAEGLSRTGKQIDDIATKINPKLTDLDRSTDTAGQAVVGAIRNKDFSFDQTLTFNFTIPGAGGSTKTQTWQNRYGPSGGSQNDDFRGGKPAGGL